MITIEVRVNYPADTMDGTDDTMTSGVAFDVDQKAFSTKTFKKMMKAAHAALHRHFIKKGDIFTDDIHPKDVAYGESLER